MPNNLRSFMVVHQIDGVPFYWRPQVKEWVRDKPLGKVYKRLAVAEQVAAEYHGTVVELLPEPPRSTYKQLQAERDKYRTALEAIQTHHTELNRMAGRPESASTTLSIIREALAPKEGAA